MNKVSNHPRMPCFRRPVSKVTSQSPGRGLRKSFRDKKKPVDQNSWSPVRPLTTSCLSLQKSSYQVTPRTLCSPTEIKRVSKFTLSPVTETQRGYTRTEALRREKGSRNAKRDLRHLPREPMTKEVVNE